MDISKLKAGQTFYTVCETYGNVAEYFVIHKHSHHDVLSCRMRMIFEDGKDVYYPTQWIGAFPMGNKSNYVASRRKALRLGRMYVAQFLGTWSLS